MKAVKGFLFYLFYQVLITFLYAHSVCAEPIVTVNETYYQIWGTSKDINKQMEMNKIELRGGKYSAIAYWIIDPFFDTKKNIDGRCFVTDVRVYVNLMYNLPKWVYYHQEKSSQIKNQWDQYAGILKSHEYGHGNIAVTGAKEIEKTLINMKPLSDCKQLKVKATQLAKKMVNDCMKKQEAYDSLTKHGTEQTEYKSEINPLAIHGSGSHQIKAFQPEDTSRSRYLSETYLKKNYPQDKSATKATNKSFQDMINERRYQKLMEGH